MSHNPRPPRRFDDGASPRDSYRPAAYDSVPIRVAIASEHALFREAVRTLVEAQAGFCFVGEAANDEQARLLVGRAQPDVLLLDVGGLAGINLDVLRDIAQAAPATRTLLLTGEATAPRIVDALQRGARGVVLKSAPTGQLFKSISAVMAGEYWISRELVAAVIDRMRDGRVTDATSAPRTAGRLTPREAELVAAVAAGYSNREIAERLSISPKTVKHHLTNIFEKLGLSNRVELALSAVHDRLDSHPRE